MNSGLGRFLTAVQDGTAAAIVRRTNIENVATMARSPLAWLALGAAVFAFLVMPRPWGGLTDGTYHGRHWLGPRRTRADSEQST